MRDEGVYLVPTLSVYAAMCARGPELGAPEYIQRKTAEVLDASREAFRLALAIDVPVAAGTDCHPHGTLPEELRLMVEAGANPMQVLCFAMSAAADLLGIGDEAGTLEPGKAADLVAVAGDLLEDIEALRKVRLGVRGGVDVSSSNEA
jgi:imidazolonepropionase-like amidohydrolase